MADTLPNTPLPQRVWVDLYGATGIPVGTQILVQNIGDCDVYLASQADQPTSYAAYQILKRGEFARNDFNDNGAWAFCLSDGALNVRLP